MNIGLAVNTNGREQNPNNSALATPIKAQAKQEEDAAPSPSELLAEKIITGLVSERRFLKINLAEEEILEVFKHIRTERGWQIDDDNLLQGIRQQKLETASEQSLAASSNCTQWIEVKAGNQYTSPPPYITFTRSGECSTREDVILAFSTPKWPNTNPDKVRIGSDLWWIRWMLSALTLGRGVAANSLCSNTTRVYAGYRVLSLDTYLLYLWHE